MKSKLVLWGTNGQDERVLIAMQLRTDENKVDIWLFPEAVATPEFAHQMLNDWRNDTAEVAFPESGISHIARELSVADSLLPDDIRVERADILNRAQTEWHFIVLSTKLHAAYRSELAELEDKIKQLSNYSGEAWNTLKGFWDKVQNQVKERNLFRDHADELRDATNGLFAQLKDMRTTVQNEFEDNSKVWYEQFNTILDDIEKKVEIGVQKFPDLFDQLKNTQSQFRDKKMVRKHADELWNRLDGLFKTVKEKKFGKQPETQNDGSQSDRLKSRYEGLISAIDKMQDSIDRDRQDLDYQKKRVEMSEGQLEAQIRQAKIKMIQERVNSKQEKLNEMLATKTEVESRLASAKVKDAKREKEAAEKKTDVTTEAKTESVAEVTTEILPTAEAKAEEKAAAIVKTAPSVSKPENGHDSEFADIAANANAAVEAVEHI